MKKVIICGFLVLSIFSAVSLFSIDFGGYLDNTTSYSTDEETGFYQLDRIRLWLSAGLGKDWSFMMMGNYTFELDYPYLFDLEQLSLTGKWLHIENGPSLFSIQMGRFLFSEFTRLVLDHNADGIQFTFGYPAAVFSAGFGYTGLLSKYSSTITLSKADTNDQADPDILLATPRILGLLKLHFPDFIKRQDLYFSALFQKDLHSEERMIPDGTTEFLLIGNKGGYYDSIYAGTGISGTIVSSLYYNLFGYFQTGRTLSFMDDEDSPTGQSYQYAPVMGLLIGSEISYFMKSILYSMASLSFVYASGDGDSNSNIEGNTGGYSYLFNPISDHEQRVIYNPKLSNIFYIKGAYSIKPLSMLGKKLMENVLVLLNGTVFFRSTTGAVTDQKGLNPDSKALYLGTEIDFNISFRPYSDLGASLSAGYFMPNNGTDGAFFEDGRVPEFAGKFELSFSF
jgi:hypothetical protein